MAQGTAGGGNPDPLVAVRHDLGGHLRHIVHRGIDFHLTGHGNVRFDGQIAVAHEVHHAVTVGGGSVFPHDIDAFTTRVGIFLDQPAYVVLKDFVATVGGHLGTNIDEVLTDIGRGITGDLLLQQDRVLGRLVTLDHDSRVLLVQGRGSHHIQLGDPHHRGVGH
ncbi:hypothetical protein D3C79_660360 [compost metagenome]